MSKTFVLPVEVYIGPIERVNGIVSLQVDCDNLIWHAGYNGKLNPASVTVTDMRTGNSVRSQLSPGGITWLMEGKSEAGDVRLYEIRFDTEQPREGKLNTKDLVILTDFGTELVATINETELCRYKYREVWKPFFHPVHGPDGIVTRGEVFDNEGHPFHHGIWMAYGTMEAEGTNMWSESGLVQPRRGMTGRMEHETFELIRYGRVFAEFRERLIYRKPDGYPFAREHRSVRIYRPDANTQYIDWQVRLEEPDDKGPRTMTFSARVAPSMRVRDLSNRTPEHPMGIPLQNPGRIAKGEGWADFSGPVERGWNGLALFDHPDNPDYPKEPFATEYGTFTGLGRPYPVSSAARGGVAELRYRAYIHAGDADEGRVAQVMMEYTHPAVAVAGKLQIIDRS